MKTTQKNDKTRKIAFLLTFGFAMLCLFSCNDAKLSEQLDGTWYTSYTQKDEDGMPYVQEQEVTFTHLKSDHKGGGRFVEKVTTELKTEENNVSVNCKTVCTISGEWEIIEGGLYMKYVLSSMDVKVEDLECELSEDAALGFAILGIDRETFEGNVAEEIRKNTYHDMYETYQQSNKEDMDGSCFPNLRIEGDTMSYDTSDLGRIEWARIE